MKSKLLVLAALAVLVAPLRAADKAQVEAHYQSYYTAGKAVVEMAISRKVDAAEVAKRVDIMVADALWLAGEYAKIHPKGAKLLQTVTSNVDAMRQLSFDNLEHEWHDLGYFAKPGNDVGLDLKAEENEHFTDPIHTLVHPHQHYLLLIFQLYYCFFFYHLKHQKHVYLFLFLIILF